MNLRIITTVTLWVTGILTLLISSSFIYFCWSRFAVIAPRSINWAETGQVGDFVGGVIGTLISIMGFISLYYGLEAQRKADAKQDKQFEKSQIENRFIELIKMHKENLYDIYIERNGKEIKERKAIDFITGQIHDCYQEIARFFANVSAADIYTPSYFERTIVFNLRRTDIDLLHLAQIDIAYSIVFFGTSHEDLQSLAKLFNQYYDEEFIKQIVLFIRLKPFDKDLLQDWKELIKYDPSADAIKENIEMFLDGKQITSLNEDDPKYLAPLNNLLANTKQQKYYGGHQYKLGQYFRHLFQTVRYINDISSLSYQDKYAYIKMLRAQLSTIEQYLIFYNSVSFMGRPWELSFVESGDNTKLDEWFITKYNIIKNIPDFCLLENVNVLSYYPDVKFEFRAVPESREALEKKFT